MNESVFLDTGIFVALLNARDQWHEQAVLLFGGTTPVWYSSYLVVSECYSLFLHRYGEETARQLILFLDSLPGLQLLEATAAHHAGVLKMLSRLRGAKLTYVDAASLYFMDTLQIRKAWSTDHHLGLTGATVLPRM